MAVGNGGYGAMIQSVTLENWQSWENDTIDFVDGFNVLLGLSDSGKSSVLRAIEWCLLNNHPGQAKTVIREGEKSCRVTVELNDCTIVREVGDKNKYFLIQGDKEKEFANFGRGVVPEDIQEAINMEEINFQSQHSGAFLFSATSGEVARYLNEIVDLSIIDRSNHKINVLVKANKQDMQVAEQLIKRYETNIDVYKKRKEIFNEPLKDFNEAYEEYVEITQDIAKNREKIDNINKITRKVDLLERKINSLAKYVKVAKTIEGFEGLYQKHQTITRRISKMRTLLRKIDGLINKLEREENLLKRSKKELEELKAQGCPLCGSKEYYGNK